MEEADNLERQMEEVEALRAIYDRAWICDSEEEAATKKHSGKVVIEESPVRLSGTIARRRGPRSQARIFRIAVKRESSDDFVISLTVRLPPLYPSASPPYFELNSPHLNAVEKRLLAQELNDAYLENVGEPVLFQWIETLRNFVPSETVADVSQDNSDGAEEASASPETYARAEECEDVACPDISSGDAVTDRKSTFQAHVASVTSKLEVQKVLETLKSNPKIARATHNIVAYRFHGTREGVVVQDCEDDGEHGAGARLLHLLNMMDTSDCIVVVSRWYGGIHLGPDRFKHINSVARLALEAANLGRENSSDGKKKVKKKGKT